MALTEKVVGFTLSDVLYVKTLRSLAVSVLYQPVTMALYPQRSAGGIVEDT